MICEARFGCVGGTWECEFLEEGCQKNLISLGFVIKPQASILTRIRQGEKESLFTPTT